MNIINVIISLIALVNGIYNVKKVIKTIDVLGREINQKGFNIQIYNNDIEHAKNFNYYGSIINTVNELNIPIIDIHREFFMKQTDPLAFFPYRIFC